MSDSCVFCDIINGQASGDIRKDWESAIALVPLTPVVEGHVLIIPKAHVADAAEDVDTTAYTMACAAEYARIYPSFNLITSAGRAATQSIGHLHIHVVPRTATDQLMTPWGTIYGDDPAAPHWCKVAQELQDRLDRRADDPSLRDALVKIKAGLDERSEDGEAHLFLNIPYWDLEELLAAHPPHVG